MSPIKLCEFEWEDGITGDGHRCLLPADEHDMHECTCGAVRFTKEPKRTWSLPAEPGPEVLRLRCKCHGFVWRQRYAPPCAAWEPAIDLPAPESALLTWRTLLLTHDELTDATEELSTDGQ